MPETTWTPLPFDEARKYFASKVPLTDDEARAAGAEARSRAFTVAGVARQDMLNDVYGAVQRAIQDGTTLDDFRKDIAHVIEEQGWTGPKAYRVDNIFRNNVQMAYGSGRLEQLQQNRKRRPYWRYRATQDFRTRPSHRALDGKVFAADDPFWLDHFPPWDWGCRCQPPDSVSPERLDAEGIQVERGEDWKGSVEVAPGKFVAITPNAYQNPLRAQAMTAPAAESEAVAAAEPVGGMPTAAELGRPALRAEARMDLGHLPVPQPHPASPDGAADAESVRAVLRQAFGMGDRGEHFHRDAVNDPVTIDGSTVEVLRRLPELAVWAAVLPSLLSDPWELWLVPFVSTATGRYRMRKHYVGRWSDSEQVLLLAVERGQVIGGEVRDLGDAADIEAARRGYLLRSRRGDGGTR